MADTGIFATTAEVQRKVGANASTVANVEAYINDFMTQAESEINITTRFNWSDAYSALNVDVKGFLKEAASNLAAIYVINYDATAFPFGLSEAESRKATLLQNYQRCIAVLKDKTLTEPFMRNA